MKLIGSLTSPFVRKVRVVLAEKKIECEFEIDSPWTPESNVPNINPLGKIPTLVLEPDDGRLQMNEEALEKFVVTAKVIGQTGVEGFNHVVDEA